jgi:hypothetical protein
MTLAPLAADTDLQVKGVDITNTALVTLMLDVASSVIREAAGSTISQTTSTVTLLAPESRWLTLPGVATSVTSILIDGEAETEWKFAGGMVWRWCGWSVGRVLNRPFRHGIAEPVTVTITYTHGLPTIPADIVNLCADLAKLGIESVGQEVPAPALAALAVTIDDYTENVQYAAGARSLMELSETTKAWLAQRFGSGVYVTGELRW